MADSGLRILAAFAHFNWEDYNLQPALEDSDGPHIISMRRVGIILKNKILISSSSRLLRKYMKLVP